VPVVSLDTTDDAGTSLGLSLPVTMAAHPDGSAPPLEASPLAA